MARLVVDDSVYNVRTSRIKTRVRFPHLIRTILEHVGGEESSELTFIARTFAFMMLDTEYVSGPQCLPLVDNIDNLHGEILLEAWDKFTDLDALTFPKDFWAAHVEANTPLNDPEMTPEALFEAEADPGEKKAG
jgi:hypothetical protein